MTSPRFCIKNPLTSRMIQVNGPAYRDLLEAGYAVNDKREFPRKSCGGRNNSKSPRRSPRRATPLSLERELKRLSPGQRSKKAGLKAMIHKKSRPESGRSYTAGWHAASPQKGRQRQTLYKKCGRKCFLRPNDLGYPICQKCNGDRCSCKVDCRATRAAYSYARKYKASNIANAARRVAKQVGCEWV